MVTMTDEVSNPDLNQIKKKLTRGWSVRLANELGVSRKTISSIFREKRFNSPVWDEINRMVSEYDERERAATNSTK